MNISKMHIPDPMNRAEYRISVDMYTSSTLCTIMFIMSKITMIKTLPINIHLHCKDYGIIQYITSRFLSSDDYYKQNFSLIILFLLDYFVFVPAYDGPE